MPKVYRISDENGKFSPWQYFSERSGSIIEAGDDELVAQAQADAESPDATIMEALKGTDVQNENQPEESSTVSDVPQAVETIDRLEGPNRPERTSGNDKETTKPVSDRPAISQAFLKKIKERAASGTTEITVELERYLIARIGYSTEELDETDPDVELLKDGWALQWEYWLAGKNPPAWVLILFGQLCVTVRLVASAKKKQAIESKATTEIEDTTEEQPL